MPAAKCQLGGMNLAFPDVCKMPVPIPLPDIALPIMGVLAAYNILYECMPAHNLLTTTPITLGDTPGFMGGVVSQVDMGPSRDVTGAFTVLVDGIPSTRLTSISIQNLINAVGMSIVPSQLTVWVFAP
jgi:Domain of unknown function (DUF4150)